MNRIVVTLSKLLEPGERECACGDLEELGLSGPVAAANILGLVLRRQLAEWGFWKPWASLAGVAGLTGYFLSGFLFRVETRISLQIQTYLRYGVVYEPGGVHVAQVIAYAVIGAMAIALWFWACGFVLASLSKRTVWMTLLLFYVIVQDAFTFQLAMSGSLVLKHGLLFAMLYRLLPVDPLVIALLFALAMGVRAASRGMLPQTIYLWVAALGLALSCLLVWMESWFASGFAHWSGQRYLPPAFFFRVLPWLVAAWPMFSIPLLQNRHGSPRRLTT